MGEPSRNVLLVEEPANIVRGRAMITGFGCQHEGGNVMTAE